jgi:3-oxoadipate enol-lactonase
MSAQLVTQAPLAYLRWDPPVPATTADPTVVILLHGIGGGREAWGDVMSSTGRHLAQAGFVCLAVDLPGYGASAPHHPLSITSMAQAVLSLQDALDVRRAVIVGHSMGGMVAQEIVALAPDRVQALVISASSPAFGKSDGAWQAQFLRDRLAKLDAGLGMTGLAPALVRSMVATLAPHAYIAHATVLMSGVPEATYRSALQALMGFDRRANLPHIRVPVLCLAGDEDRNAPPPVMKHMADRIPGSAFVCLQGVGHLANMEAPGLFNRTVTEFLLRHRSQDGIAAASSTP